MIEEARKDHKFTLRESSKGSFKFLQEKYNQYKIELIKIFMMKKLPFVIMLISQILCKGGHIPSTGHIKAVKLLMLLEHIGEVMKKINNLLGYMEFLFLSRNF